MQARVLAPFLVAAVLAGLGPGCSSDKSLGSGLAGVFYGFDAAATSRCGNAAELDAGAGTGQGLVALYRCESATGPSANGLADSSSHGNDATLETGAGGAPGFSFAPGKVGNALDLVVARQGYVSLPEGLLADACEVTIATWVYINSNVNAWTRLWDFGQGTDTYMFLTPITNTDGNVAKFAISVRGNTDEEIIEAPTPVPALRWTHVALVMGPAGGVLYFDGSVVATNASMTLRPADLGRTVHNWIGRSEFTQDPYLDGDIDEFRIYDRALSADEIRALVNGS